MADVVCLGELLVDMVSDTADASLGEAPRFLKAPGGAPANVAVGVARLGATSSFIGQVGDDPFGHWLRETIEREAVDVSHLLMSQVARTTIAFVATRSDGLKDICFYRNPGADLMLTSSDLRPRHFEGARLFHCGSVSLSQSPCREAQFHAAQMCFERGIPVSFDPNWRPSLWEDKGEARDLIWQMIALSSIVKVADEEWEFITGTTDFEAGAAQIRAMGPRLVVVTRGAHGAYYNAVDSTGAVISGDIPGFKVDAIDTLGAGDSFMAGLLSQVLKNDSLNQILNHDSLAEAVRFANACGAIATQTAGAIPSLPTSEAVASFMSTSNY